MMSVNSLSGSTRPRSWPLPRLEVDPASARAPESREDALVGITIVNDDWGFPPDGIRRLLNGRVLLRPAHVFVLPCGSCYDPDYAFIEASENLRDWTEEPDLGGDGYDTS